ncbi:unnamed protein product [Arctogadus glacialis]
MAASGQAGFSERGAETERADKTGGQKHSLQEKPGYYDTSHSQLNDRPSSYATTGRRFGLRVTTRQWDPARGLIKITFIPHPATSSSVLSDTKNIAQDFRH